MRRLLLAALATTLGGCGARADTIDWSGDAVLRRCAAPATTFDQGWCVGVLLGTVGALDGYLFCMPEGATLAQAREIVLAHLHANPESRSLPARVPAALSLSAAWPCRRKS